MRLHTNGIEHADTIRNAMRSAAGNAPDVSVTSVTEHGSRTHRKAFEVALQGHGSRHRKNNASNTGKAATRDDWGWFLAALYAIDGDMVAGPYKDRSDFARQTTNDYT